MRSKFVKGELVHIYNSGKAIVDEIELRNGKYWYSFLDPETKQPTKITFYSNNQITGSKRDWQEERYR